VEEVELLIAKVGTEALPESLLPAGTIMEDHRLKVAY
jgi:hypothetical protein